MNKHILLGLLAVSILFSCKTIKTASGVKMKKMSTAKLNGKVLDSNIDFTTLNAKAKANVVMNGNKNGITLNVRMKKDSIIWVSATALLGIEVIRMVVTPDSVHLLDRLGKKYYAQDFSFFEKQLNTPFDFNAFEDLLVGNVVHYNQDHLESSIKDDHYYLETRKKNTQG